MRLFWFILAGITLSPNFVSKSSAAGETVLRVRIGTQLPVDPLYLKSMAEYDWSLMLYRAWFKYDEGRRADRGLVSSWSFDPKTGIYDFKIEDLKWSDGTALTSDHLIQNIFRVIKSKTSYGKSLASIIDKKSLRAISPLEFSFRTTDRKASDTLFNQLGSVFLSVVHPDDLDKDKTRLQKVSKTLGPYTIANATAEEVVLKRNPYFPLENPKSPERIEVRNADPNFKLADFLAKKTWNNYYQISTLVPKADAQKILDSGFSIWTRGFDRVAMFKPLGKGKALQLRKDTLVVLGRSGQGKTIQHPLQLSTAQSLQPLGYPLYEAVTYPKKDLEPLPKIKILTYSSPALDLYSDLLPKLAESLQIAIEWQVVTQEQFLHMDWDDSGCDYALFSFGVADPEPTTWLSLLFESKFISFDKTDLNNFHELMKERKVSRQVSGYRKLLKEIGARGGYLPLLHAATVVLGRPEMNFKKVNALDETVDYSKIQFEK